MLIGSRLGSYEVLAKLGEGGMGEVYRATDTNLGRQVAIKILPPEFAADAERVARFDREARTLASLNHPHIAQVYGFEKSAGSFALAMELVEGEDLSQRIARGPIPLDEALLLARQIAEALEAAHDAGIIHRDLKPANIKVRPDGTVKVLDFGLAKAVDATPQAGGATITSPAVTMHGVILGTAAYMAPEQAKGKPVDKRADIWAFGCVLYEMLTGARAFEGEDISDTLASVLRAEPDYAKLSTDVPVPLRAIVKRCLTKDVRQRARDIGDIRLQIEELRHAVDVIDAVSPSKSAVASSASAKWPLAVAALAVVAAIAAGTLAWSRPASVPAAPLFRGTIDLEVEGQVWALMGPGAVLSPDGRTLAVVVDRPGKANQVFVRQLDQDRASPVAGTDGARNIFFSPDGQSLGFFADGKLKRVPVSGGAATTLADAVEDRGGYWAADDTILFAPTARTTIRRVSAAGGAVEEVTRLAAGETGHRWPQLLPGGRGLLYTLVRSDGMNEAVIVDPLDGSERRVVQDPGFFGRYVTSGHLVFMRRDATLMAAAFDLANLTPTSPAVPVLNDVRYGIGPAGAQMAISDSGSAVYLKGGLKGGAWNMIWFDRNGVERPLASERANYRDPRLSPDGTKVASTKARADNDIWIFDVERGTDSRLTFENTSEVDPLWTPDGRHVTYAVISLDAPNAVYWKRADGTGNPQLLVRDERGLIPFSWHPNGRVLALVRQLPGNTSDVVTTEFTGDELSGLKAGPLVPFAATGFAESEPAFSPDGRWLAYQSNESGRYEIYVSGYPGPTGRWQISNAAGLFPTWGADGRTLYYRSPEQQIMMVTYEVKNGAFSASAPEVWAPTRLDDLGMVVRTFDVHPDGRRMLGLRMPPDERETSVKVTLFANFFDELRRHVVPAR